MIKLTNIEINKYKSVETEQSFDVDEKVTTLVGKNESGKTATLEAIAKVNYFEKDPKFKFNSTYDYPRKEKKKFDKSGKDVNVIKCTYEISTELFKKIKKDVGASVFENRTFTYSRSYLSKSGKFGGIAADRLKFLTLKLKEYKIKDEKFIIKVKQICSEKERNALITDIDKDESITDDNKGSFRIFLSGLKKYFKNSWDWQGGAISEYVAREWIDPNLPKFLYYDEYYALPSTIEIKDLQKENLEEEKLKTSKALFELADINIEELLNDDDYELYKSELEATSNEITSKLFKYWKTNTSLRVEFDIEQKKKTVGNNTEINPILQIRVYNQKYMMSLPLASRSKGFNWFFSFIVWFSKIQEDKYSNYILLLDEPGLNLHGKAQEDLLNFIEDLAKDYQILYTTHSPFMVYSGKLHRVRTVVETDNGTKISDSIQEKDPDTLFPLQAALGYDIAQNLFISKNNLLIEGVSDLIYLTIMSNLLERNGRKGLRENITLVPTGGLDKVTAFISLIRGQKLRIACLLDTFTDQKGKARLDNLIQKKIVEKNKIHFFDEFASIDSKKADIEDLFEKEEYLKIFNIAFNEHKDIKVKDLDVQTKQIIPQINKALGIKNFNHYRPANELNKINVDSSFFSSETLDRFEKVFKVANSLF